MRFLLTLFCFFIANITFCQDFGGVLQFYRKGKQGLVDSVGTIILPAEYESIHISQNKKYIVVRQQEVKAEEPTSNGEFSQREIYSTSGRDTYDHPKEYSKSGVLNTELDTVIPFASKSIHIYENYYFIGGWSNFKVLNENLKQLTPHTLESAKQITQPYSGLWYYTTTGFSGVLDKEGNQLFKELPLWIQPLAANLFVAKINSKYVFLNKKLKKVHDFSFNSFELINPNTVVFQIGQQHKESKGLINTKGKIVLPAEYANISYNERNQVYIVQTKEYKYGLLNNKLKTIVPFEYDFIKEGIESDLFLVSKDKKYGFINAKGEMVIDMMYNAADVFSEGLAPVLKDGKWGFINEKGDTVINFKFEGRLTPFQNGYATYRKGNQSVFIDKKGEMVGELGDHDYDIKYYSKQKGIRHKSTRYYESRSLVDLKTGKVIFYLAQ